MIEVFPMPKALCIASLVVCSIVLLLFLLNLVAKIPFGGDMMLMNIAMIIGAGIVGAFSVLTFLESR